MTSNPETARAPTQAYVWAWLPGNTEPVVAGLLTSIGKDIQFTYGRSYLARKNAVPLYMPELPLERGPLPLLNGLRMPNAIRDAAPDAWGRRIILNRRFGAKSKDLDTIELDELAFLLESGSDRVGALDFQESAEHYKARESGNVSLDDLLVAAEHVEKGIPLTPELGQALLHGTSIGGARPKTAITSDDKKYIAKFSSQNDVYSVVKAEFIAMRLAGEAGLNVAPVHLERAAGKDVLLVERFDREKKDGTWARKMMVSALTLLELDEMMGRYASYENLATIVRHRFTKPKETLRELYSRMVFNVLCGNTDDHARNHAAFWDGTRPTLTPAYDLCPQARSGGEAAQAMLILGGEKQSQIALCIKAAPSFLLNKAEAATIVKSQINVIKERWSSICTDAKLSEVDKNLFWRRQFLNPYAFIEAPKDIASLVE
jgi:serine/threonine-protein kinase HipA